MANLPKSLHSPVSGGGSLGEDTMVAIAADRVAVGISTPKCRYEEAVATAAEMAVGETSWKAKVGSKPGGGSMK